MQPEVPLDVDAFRAKVRRLGEEHWRDLAWRHTRDAYQVWLSEVMLQQTQVMRVETRWPEWLRRFPTVEALAQATDAEVLEAWQGMGYNRRALALHRAAQVVASEYDGVFPRAYGELVALPGVGPSTAAGVRAFAFDEPGVYLETNVRSVFIHELFPTSGRVPDAALVPLVRAACPERDVRGWYYALLDYGAHLKRTVPNPSRRAGAYARQSRFEGSRRQKRAALLRLLLAAGPQGASEASLAHALAAQELAAGRPEPETELVADILADLAREGFCARTPDGAWAAGRGA